MVNGQSDSGSVVDDKDLAEKLNCVVAGETISWYMFERYLNLARPKTLSTLMKAVKTEAYMEATQDKVLTPRQKIAIMTIIIVVIVGILGFYLIKGLGIF